MTSIDDRYAHIGPESMNGGLLRNRYGAAKRRIEYLVAHVDGVVTKAEIDRLDLLALEMRSRGLITDDS